MIRVDFDPAIRRKYIRRYARQDGQYTKSVFLAICLYVLAIAIVCAFTFAFSNRSRFYTPQNSEVLNSIAGFLFGIALGTPVFLIGNTMVTRSRRKSGWPFTGREYEFIQVTKESVLYGYRPVNSTGNAERVTYEILRENIHGISYDPKTRILVIEGEGIFKVYPDFEMQREASTVEHARMYDDSQYQIMLATDAADRILLKLRSAARIAQPKP